MCIKGCILSYDYQICKIEVYGLCVFFSLALMLDQIKFETDKFQIQEKKLVDEVSVRTSELAHLEQELELMNETADMAFNNQHSIDFYIDQLNEQVQAKRNYLLTLESEWQVELFK